MLVESNNPDNSVSRGDAAAPFSAETLRLDAVAEIASIADRVREQVTKRLRRRGIVLVYPAASTPA